MIIDIDPKRIVAFGPHNDGGMFINWNGGTTIRVKETVEEFKNLIKDDRTSS